MLRRFLVVAMASVLLSACTDADWDRSLSHVGLADSPPAAVPQQPPSQDQALEKSQASAQEDWCMASSRHAAERIKDLGFDQATQNRRAREELEQCRRLVRAN